MKCFEINSFSNWAKLTKTRPKSNEVSQEERTLLFNIYIILKVLYVQGLRIKGLTR